MIQMQGSITIEIDETYSDSLLRERGISVSGDVRVVAHSDNLTDAGDLALALHDAIIDVIDDYADGDDDDDGGGGNVTHWGD